MKIAYLHFHLKTGGVTTVIRQQVEALQGTCETVALTGRPPEKDFPCKVITVPGIGYDSDSDTLPPPGEAAEAVVRAIRAHWKDGCDVLHVHNPTLAKNKNTLNILKILKSKGVRLFLQIHDFAEDGRPRAYFDEAYLRDCHYGVINSRDYDLLVKSGLNPQGLHLVSNMVTPLPVPPTAERTTGPVLYPVRAIRRKNIGEAILLSLYFQDNQPLYITLPPNSPADFPAYESWKTFVVRHRLKVEFEAGLTHDFTSLVQSAGSLLTTSVSEGFGFSFMEPWTAGKFLWGRDLAGVTDDFKKAGVRLDHLYTRLRVPLQWVGRDRFFHSWQQAVHDSLHSFKLEKPGTEIREAYERLTDDGTLDFGLLNEKYQQQVVRRVVEPGPHRETLIQLNPFLADCGQAPTTSGWIADNRRRVLDRYSQATYRESLTELYSTIAATEPVHAIDKRMLLDKFLDLHNFSLLKWGRHDT